MQAWKESFGFWYDTADDFFRWTRMDLWVRLRRGQSLWKDCFDSQTLHRPVFTLEIWNSAWKQRHRCWPGRWTKPAVCIEHSDLFSWESRLQMETGDSAWETNKCWSLGDALLFLDTSLLHFMRTSYQWVKDIPSLFLALVPWLVCLNKAQQMKAL